MPEYGSVLEAADAGDLESVRTLVAEGADLLKRTGNGATALHCAAARGYKEICDFLIDGGLDVNGSDYDGRTVLHFAAFGGSSDAIDLLVRRGASVSAVDDADRRTPLHVAAVQGRVEAINMLVAAGAEVDEQDGSGRTGLWHAASSGHVDAMEVLLALGADIDAADEGNVSPLLAALMEEQKEAASVLLSMGASWAVREGQEGLAALHIAAAHGDKDMVDLLLESGADPDVRSTGGGRPEEAAETAGHSEIAALLRERREAAAQELPLDPDDTSSESEDTLVVGRKRDLSRSSESVREEDDFLPGEVVGTDEGARWGDVDLDGAPDLVVEETRSEPGGAGVSSSQPINLDEMPDGEPEPTLSLALDDETEEEWDDQVVPSLADSEREVGGVEEAIGAEQDAIVGIGETASADTAAEKGGDEEGADTVQIGVRESSVVEEVDGEAEEGEIAPIAVESLPAVEEPIRPVRPGRWRRRVRAFVAGMLGVVVGVCTLVFPTTVQFTRESVELPEGPPGVPEPWGVVSDYANVLEDGVIARLSADIEGLKRGVGSEMVIVTVPYTEPLLAQDYAERVAETWRPGAGGEDNGVVFLYSLSTGEPVVRVGTGLAKVLHSAKVARIVKEEVDPRVEVGDYGGGIGAGASALLAVLAEDQSKAAEERADPTSRVAGRERGGTVGRPASVTAREALVIATIESRPLGATAVIDNGVRRGRTPFVVVLKPGEHQVYVSMPGYRPESEVIHVGLQPKKYVIELQPILD